MKVFIIGRNGQLGSAFERFILNGKWFSPKTEWILFDRESMDITDYDRIKTIVDDYNPKVIVNCSAYTNVNDCETEEGTQKSLQVNVVGNLNLANICASKNITYITFSSDYVYGNAFYKPIAETDVDLACPLNVYGEHKRMMEKMVSFIMYNKNYLIFRVSWLWSIENKNSFVNKIIDKLNVSEENFTVVDDQIGTPTCCEDLVTFIVNMILKQKYKGNSGIYNYSNEGSCSWYDFAMAIKEIYDQHSVVEIKPSKTVYDEKIALRPSYSVMDKTKVKETFGITIPWWKESLSKSK